MLRNTFLLKVCGPYAAGELGSCLLHLLQQRLWRGLAHCKSPKDLPSYRGSQQTLLLPAKEAQPLAAASAASPPKEPGAFSSVGSTSQGGLLVNLQSYFSYVLQIEATLACNFQWLFILKVPYRQWYIDSSIWIFSSYVPKTQQQLKVREMFSVGGTDRSWIAFSFKWSKTTQSCVELVVVIHPKMTVLQNNSK